MTIPAAATPLPSRILTLAAENATGLRRLIVRFVRWRYGFFPGLARILLVDLRIGLPAVLLFWQLHLRRSSPLTWLQREMLATVVNGKIGGAP